MQPNGAFYNEALHKLSEKYFFSISQKNNYEVIFITCANLKFEKKENQLQSFSKRLTLSADFS